jgi:hypothetical protein
MLELERVDLLPAIPVQIEKQQQPKRRRRRK